MLRRLEDQDDLSPQQFCEQWDEEDTVGEGEEELDSDDDEDLATRMKGIDLDDSDTVWARLTDSERESFRQMVQSGDVTQILPEYMPWWEVAGNNEAPGIVELSEEEAAISLKNDAGSGSKSPLWDDARGSEPSPKVEHLSEHKLCSELSKHGDNKTEVENEEKMQYCSGVGKEKNIVQPDSSHVGPGHHNKQLLGKISGKVKKIKLRKCPSAVPNSGPSQEQSSLLTWESIPAALKDKYQHCPKPVAIKPLESLISCPPSPLVCYSLLNTAASYAWLLRLFHGDHYTTHVEAAETVLSLSAALASRTRLDSADQALSSIHMRAIQHEWLCSSDAFMQTVTTDAATLLTGPSDLPGYYLHSALADLRTILSAALSEPETISCRDGGSGSFLSSLHGAQRTIPRNLATPKIIHLALKKLNFFLSYAFSFRLQIREEFLSLL